jgi:hypothetical protein
MMEIEVYVHVIGIILTVVVMSGYLTYRYFKKRKKK